MLEQMFLLPYEFSVPDLLFERDLKGDLGDRLLACGLNVVELYPQEVVGAMDLHRSSGKLSFPESFALVLARERNWTLLTGSGPLCKFASDQQMTMHGVLWVIEQCHQEGVMATSTLHRCLSIIFAHERCRLPPGEVRRLLSLFSAN